MKNKPLVSVLIPAYNASRYITETVESVQYQPYKNVEILIADDKSNDDTVRVIRRLMKKDSRIKLIENKENLYIAENRNVLVAAAKGKYIAWLDSDDIADKMRITKQVEMMEGDKRLGIVGGYLELFFDDGRNLGIRYYAHDDTTLRKVIFRYSPISQGAAMIRREALEKAGRYDPATPPAEDLDMLFRIGTMYRFGNIDGLSIRYRQHDLSATRSKLRKIELTTVRTRFKYMFNKTYKATPIDFIYNCAHLFSIWLVPSEFKIKIFNKLRDRR